MAPFLQVRLLLEHPRLEEGTQLFFVGVERKVADKQRAVVPLFIKRFLLLGDAVDYNMAVKKKLKLRSKGVVTVLFKTRAASTDSFCS